MLEEHNQLKRPDRDPLEVNSIYVVDDAKQRKKMTAAFYRSVRREIAEYEERVTHLIQRKPEPQDHGSLGHAHPGPGGEEAEL